MFWSLILIETNLSKSSVQNRLANFLSMFSLCNVTPIFSHALDRGTQFFPCFLSYFCVLFNPTCCQKSIDRERGNYISHEQDRSSTELTAVLNRMEIRRCFHCTFFASHKVLLRQKSNITAELPFFKPKPPIPTRR